MPERDTLYFDGQCGLCRRSIRIIRSLDWLNRLRFVDSNSLPDDELPVPRDDALTGIPMRSRTGKAMIGFPAVRRALVQTPLGAIPAALLFIPGVSHIGARVYNHIAANRGRDIACDMPAARTDESSS